jgi:hypothetical protein
MHTTSLGRSMRRLAPLAALALLLPSCGADTLITGIGNRGNTVGFDAVERLANELANAPTTPKIGDDDLRAVFATIREHALAGDPQAAFVLLRVAANQRQKK